MLLLNMHNRPHIEYLADNHFPFDKKFCYEDSDNFCLLIDIDGSCWGPIFQRERRGLVVVVVMMVVVVTDTQGKHFHDTVTFPLPCTFFKCCLTFPHPMTFRTTIMTAIWMPPAFIQLLNYIHMLLAYDEEDAVYTNHLVLIKTVLIVFICTTKV
jgi:hypothetical protein